MSERSDIPAEQALMDLLGRYEIAAHQRENYPPFVTWFCRPCKHVQIIARDLNGDQSGLTLAEMVESVLEHESEQHGRDVRDTGSQITKERANG